MDHIDLRDISLPAGLVGKALMLEPHPEGGRYREVWRAAEDGGRGASSSILFLLAEGERSHWHRVDAAETWLWQAGAPLRLSVAAGNTVDMVLGPAIGGAEQLQATVPAHAWQAAESLGGWTLVSCVVAPAFQFTGFEVAPPGWSPGS